MLFDNYAFLLSEETTICAKYRIPMAQLSSFPTESLDWRRSGKISNRSTDQVDALIRTRHNRSNLRTIPGLGIIIDATDVDWNIYLCMDVGLLEEKSSILQFDNKLSEQKEKKENIYSIFVTNFISGKCTTFCLTCKGKFVL